MSRKKILTEQDLDDARDEGVDDIAWMVTLSDLMMLLLTFFVMLFAITSVTNENYMGMIRKIGDALGGESLVERHATTRDEIEKDIEKIISSANLVRQVHLTTDERGTVLFAEGDLFFKAGGVILSPEIKRFLSRIAKIIKKRDNKILVEGHTDDLPISSEKYPSNWELSSARASVVVRYLIEKEGLEPRRLSAAGYASYRPRYALIPENRSRNRRVEIVILKEKL
jgi:chemotaxis protein MotB